MKGLFISLAILLVCAFVIIGCGTPAPTTSQTPLPNPQTATSAPPSANPAATQPLSSAAAPATSIATVVSNPTVAPAGQPQYGGTLKVIAQSLPTDLGYTPGFTPGDKGLAQLSLERLVVWDDKGNYAPDLAVSWDIDAVNKTVTWHLRQNVKFTDGTDFNATVLKWNYQQQIAAGSLQGGSLISSVDVVDNYTLRLQLTDIDRMAILNYGWFFVSSQAAFEKAANGDPKAGENWTRLNPVGTGPFKLADFKQGVSISWIRNDNYWRGKPYLDGIQVVLIPDTMTSSVMMKAKTADTWSAADIRDATDLGNQGLNVNYGTGMGEALLFNSSDPKSIYSNPLVRQAVEYAINRPVLAQTVGFGKFEPLTQLANSKYLGYNPGFDPRPYDVAKAKQLLASAGYPNGFHTKILTNNVLLDTATSVQAYLKAVGITADLDIADTPRFNTMLFTPGQGWSDLAIGTWGINPDATDIFVHFGPNPTTFRTGTIAKSAAYLALCNQALHTYDQAQYVDLLKQIVKQASDDAMLDPLYTTVSAYPMQTYVHSNFPFIHGLVWNTYEDWMAPH